MGKEMVKATMLKLSCVLIISAHIKKERHRLEDFISKDESEHLLFSLHRYLVWVGEKIPEEVEVDGKIKLHELIWRLIHKKQLVPREVQGINELIHVLESKEKHDEEVLKKANLTHVEAKRLYDEAAGLIRAIMDLKEIESGKKARYSEQEVEKKIDDARRWLGFLKKVKK